MSMEYCKIGPSVGVSHSFVAHADKNRREFAPFIHLILLLWTVSVKDTMT